MESLKLFQRNMDSYMKTLKPELIYLDTIGGLPLIECYNPLHPLTRTGVRESRLKIMQVATKAGAVLGAEGPPQDWNASVASFYDEGGARFGIEVPLWGMVYHDSVMLYRQHATPYNYGLDNYGYSRGPWPAKFLRGILYGDQSSWTVSNVAYWAWRKTFKQINDVLAPHQRRLAFDQLMKHQFLTPDFLVQRTNFSSGVEVTVNYGEFPYKLEDGAELLPHGYRIMDKSGSVSGSVETQVVAQNSALVRNDKVTVSDFTLKPGDSKTVTGNVPSVIVDSRRGQVTYSAGGSQTIRNNGDAEVRYVRVEFTGPGANETWGRTGLAPNYKVLLENRYARVYDIRIPAHTNEPQHTHHDRVVICLSGAKLEHLFPDGRREPSSLETGEVAYRRGTTHIGQNLGDTALWVIAVEPK